MHRINHYPLESAVVSLTLILEIVIYQVDSAIQLLSNWGLKDLKPKKGGASPYTDIIRSTRAGDPFSVFFFFFFLVNGGLRGQLTLFYAYLSK